ncbi:hypothetical protein HDU97_003491 [Phlyctochytrium planicorne]|nr:hypothetical protein HDU97_003491 [Phlyctochytrium planicorne]
MISNILKACQFFQALLASCIESFRLNFVGGKAAKAQKIPKITMAQDDEDSETQQAIARSLKDDNDEIELQRRLLAEFEAKRRSTAARGENGSSKSERFERKGDNTRAKPLEDEIFSSPIRYRKKRIEDWDDSTTKRMEYPKARKKVEAVDDDIFSSPILSKKRDAEWEECEVCNQFFPSKDMYNHLKSCEPPEPPKRSTKVTPLTPASTNPKSNMRKRSIESLEMLEKEIWSESEEDKDWETEREKEREREKEWEREREREWDWEWDNERATDEAADRESGSESETEKNYESEINQPHGKYQNDQKAITIDSEDELSPLEDFVNLNELKAKGKLGKFAGYLRQLEVPSGGSSAKPKKRREVSRFKKRIWKKRK